MEPFDDMKVIYNRLVPFRGFTAINLMGVVFARVEYRPLSAAILRHEAIHTAQMKETAFLGFYLIYISEWLWGLLRRQSPLAAYRAIRFEREAYRYMADPSYLTRRRPYAWASMSQ